MILEKAFLYRFLSVAFSYPSEEVLLSLEEGIEDLGKCLKTLNLNFPLEKLKREISNSKQRILELMGDYTTLFETQMKAPARETSYELDKTARRSAEMADLLGFYRAFGLNLSASIEPDSLVAELEFMSFLYQKEYFLLQNGDTEGVEIVKDAREKFLIDHLGRWYKIFVEKVRENAEEKLYPVLTELLESFLDKETENLKGIRELKEYKKETAEGSTWKCGFM